MQHRHHQRFCEMVSAYPRLIKFVILCKERSFLMLEPLRGQIKGNFETVNKHAYNSSGW